MLISGSQQNGLPVIAIDVQATAPGTHRIDPSFPSPITVFFSPEGPAGPIWAAGLVANSSGELVLTSVTERNVRGTFSFVLQPVTGAGFGAAAGTKVLTDGMFDVTRFP